MIVVQVLVRVSVQQRIERNLREEYARRFHGEIVVTHGPGSLVQLGNSCASPPPVVTLNAGLFTPCSDHALIYGNLISPQFVGDNTIRCMRTFHLASCRHLEFRSVYYVPVGSGHFRPYGSIYSRSRLCMPRSRIARSPK